MIVLTSVEVCICCGAIIPEGRMICLSCEKKSEMPTPQPIFTGRYIIRNTNTGAYLLRSMTKPRIFQSRNEAWEYMRANNLNPNCFEIEKIK